LLEYKKLKKKLLIWLASIAGLLVVAAFVGVIVVRNVLRVGPTVSSHDVQKNAVDPSVTVVIDDDFSLSVSIANECVGAICCLAGFEEYSISENDVMLLRAQTLAYLDGYKDDKKVKDAVKYYQKLRKYGFGYDAPVLFATYLSPDCHHWRTEYQNVYAAYKDRLDVCNLDKLLEVTAGFYDAVDFGTFYAEHTQLYSRLLRSVQNNSEKIQAVGKAFSDFFHHGAEGTIMNFSVFEGSGNYGVAFEEDGKRYFEPKYGMIGLGFQQNIGIFVHELCHPDASVMAVKLNSNPRIKAYLDTYLTGEREEKLKSQAYAGSETYLNELITRASCMRILLHVTDEEYVNQFSLDYDMYTGFEAVPDVAEMLKVYEDGDYASFADFEDTLTDLYIQKFCN